MKSLYSRIKKSNWRCEYFYSKNDKGRVRRAWKKKVNNEIKKHFV